MIAAYFLITAAVERADQAAKEAAKEEKVELFNGKNMKLAKWEYEGETVTFDVSGTTWTPKGVYNFPLDTTYSDAMKEAVKNVNSVRWLEDVTDLSEYGLEGGQVIKLHLESEKDKADFTIGSYNASTQKCYVMKDGDDRVYLVSENLRKAFEHHLLDMAVLEEITQPANVFAFKVEVGDKSLCLESVEQFDAISSSGTAKFKWYERPNGDVGKEDAAGEEADEATVAALQKAVEQFVGAMAWKGMADTDLKNSEMETYGLKTPSCRLTLYYRETVSVSTGKFNEDGSAINEDVEFVTPITYTFGNKVDDAYYAISSEVEKCYFVDQAVVKYILDTAEYLK